ncbi:MAG: S1C family serine protease [Candidatus Vogelbacteria bacterium]|nr:S1C family serine protease [Candidatus Vogelbacteria bacterium]
MHELNNHQLILLTLLVSFVTSVATGILTVSFLDQAPMEVTRTINRVVEHTVERVVPGGIQTIVKEVPVIVTEEALVVKAINSASGAVVQILDTSNSPTKQVGSGFLVEPKGFILTKSEVSSTKPVYQVSIESGQTFPVEVVKQDKSDKVVVLKVKADRLDDFIKQTEKIDPLKISTKDVIVGQSVIGMGSGAGGNNVVSVSIIASFNASSTDALIKTNASTPDNSGGPLLDIHGEVVGMNLTSGTGLPKELLKLIIDSVK